MSNLKDHLLRPARRIASNPKAAWLALVLLCVHAARAKDISLGGVMLSGTTPAVTYVQVNGFLINGKMELRSCTGSGPIDKSTYKNLPKINLASVKSLERMPDGVMMAEVGDAAPSCVVPSNFKYNKESSLTPAEFAEKSIYTGQVTGSSTPGQTVLPPFAPGTKLVFGSSTDKELADFLLAGRIQTIPAWQTYLSSYGSSPHLAAAKAGLIELLLADGNSRLALYKSSSHTPAPDYNSLKDAHDRAAQALVVTAVDSSATELRDNVNAELKLLCDAGSTKLHAFQEATKAHKPGYPLLVSALDLSNHVTIVDMKYTPGVTLASALKTETTSLDSIVRTANTHLTANEYDDAYFTLTKYLSIAGEEPRLQQIVATVYKYHFEKGSSEINSGSWKQAVADEKAAIGINPTDEAKSALVRAEAGLLSSENKAAADRAVANSKQRVEENDPIGAYEALTDLTPAQFLLVKEQLEAVQDPYVKAATIKARELQQAHTPIRGRADEDGVRLAYSYVERASKLSENPELGLKLDVMADTISKYYVDEANKYLSKPLSSGVGLAWAFLNEANQYRPNLEAVRDAMTSSSAAYQMRARLSIGVLFRDQTSRRDSAGFADQLQQAIATGLETSGLPVRVILPGGNATLDPNFQLKGEILEHRTIRNAKKETLQSQYRSGSREIPNPEWNKADQQYESASLDLQKAQGTLTVAQAKGNKKLIETADKDVSALQQTVQAARARMNAVPKTIGDDVISPYNYTRTTLELTNLVKLSFRIVNASGNMVGEPIIVTRGETPKKYVILDNIKPDDTKGLKEIDAAPDETQLMTDVEIEARDTMVKAALTQITSLPVRILAEARDKAASSDFDSAGEAYVLYLNCTPAEPTPERSEAISFLNKNFNIRNTLNLRASAR